MTTLTELRVHRLPTPLLRPFVTAVRRADAIDVVLVEAVDSDGRSGWGEAPTSWLVTGESPESVRAAVTGPLADALRAVPTDDLEAVSTLTAGAVLQNAAARSAVECAITDLRAQAAGQSFARALCETATPARPGPLTVRTDMTLSAGPLGGLLARANEHVAAGFSCLKLKVGADSDTVAALCALRCELGSGVTLRVDANQAWSVDEAIRVIHACEDAGIGLELVEQPVAADDLNGLAAVTAAVATPILADEAIWTTRDLERAIRRRAADFVNVKLAKTGGPSEALRLAEATRAAGMELLVGCMMESAVGVAAAASLAAVLRPDAVHDLDAGLWLRTSPVRGGLRYEGERAVLADASGLGIEGLAVQPQRWSAA